MDLKLSKYHVVTPPFLDEIDQQLKRIVFATRTAEMFLIDDASWQILETGALDRLPTEMISNLIAVELLVPSEIDELATVLHRNTAAIDNTDTLYMVIQPTAYCQLGCGYCGQEHTLKWLNKKHQDAFIEQARAKLMLRCFRRFEICWFGAEPLSGITVIRSLSPRLKSLAEEFDCTYGASIITNGLALTEKVATEIVKEHAVYSIDITLDGTAEFHDARRFRKNGQFTFDQIFKNVVALAQRTDLEAVITLRSNVDRHNHEGVLPLLRMLAEANIQKRINYYVAPIHSWGNDAHTQSLSSHEFAVREIEWFCEMLQLGFSVGLVPSLVPIVCLAVQKHGMLIDASGNLFNCTEVSYVPTYGKLNKYAIGHVSNGEITGKRNLIGDFNGRIERKEYPCSSCRMLPVCGGACPKAWLEQQEPCPSALHNIEARLLLAYAASRKAGISSSMLTGTSVRRL